MGWDMDPSTSPGIGRRVCIEVYPHPAMVSLFPLDHVIPYKLKQGRDLPALKVAYQQLLNHLEVTCGAVLALAHSLRWHALRSIAAAATRKSELDEIEDEIDAIFCAYLAWLWATDRGQMVVLGDYATGYIVTPTPPPQTAVPGEQSSQRTDLLRVVHPNDPLAPGQVLDPMTGVSPLPVEDSGDLQGLRVEQEVVRAEIPMHEDLAGFRPRPRQYLGRRQLMDPREDASTGMEHVRCPAGVHQVLTVRAMHEPFDHLVFRALAGSHHRWRALGAAAVMETR